MAFLKIKSKFFNLTLPVSNREIRYRPYTVAEEEPMLTARATESDQDFSNAIKSIVEICTDGAVHGSKDSFVDVIYTFLMIRTKSVEEIAKFNIACDCAEDAFVPVVCDITKDLVITFPEVSNKIEIDNDGQIVTLVMRPLSYDKFSDSTMATSKVESDLSIFKNCIQAVVEGEETYDMQTITDDEWMEFYASMPKNVYAKIENYLACQPKIAMKINAECPHCKKVIEREIEGHENFI